MNPPLPRKNILIVDDSEITRQGLSRAAEDAGFNGISVANGQEALAMLRGGAAIDLVVLDLLMPIMDGWQFLKLLKRDPALASIPVIVLSGAADLPEQIGGLGAVGVLPKPVELDRLCACIRGFASQKRPGVLIVDGDSQARSMLGRILGHFGFAIWLADDAQEALDLYQHNQAGIDVALIDATLRETLSALQQINPQVPCCFMVGERHSQEPAGFLALGACAVLEKPFGLTDVASALRAAMRSEKSH
jgi:CheY-like chemotaxis protein